jgi:hypothetical protein
MLITSSNLALQRVSPGPLGGLFDSIAYDHPAFKLWVLVTLLLVFVSVAFAVTAHLLLPHPRKRPPPRYRGFEVVSSESNGHNGK